MSSTVDLHLHTTKSDGKLSPTELVQFVVKQGLHFISLTDHDTVDGIEEAASETKRYSGMEFANGVEISANALGEEVHILGYFIDPLSSELLETLKRAQEDRANTGKLILNKLGELGMPVKWESVELLANGGTITRPHIAQAMIDAGYILTIQEAFDKYIGEGGPANVDRKRFSHTKAINLIQSSGGVAVLAHPARYVRGLEKRLPELVRAGLVGLETYYKDYTPSEVNYLLSLCKFYKLIPTGGSDYHAFGSNDEVNPGITGPPEENFFALKALSRSNG
jgi:predicted metal-dependent phosphoesterase TrpH